LAITKVYVELEWDGTILRVVKNAEAWKIPPERLRHWPKADAIRTIRKQVFERAGYMCEFCGKNLTWEGGEMHEKLPKGKGGEVSMDNSVAVCHQCHTGRADSEHGNRRWQS
jgi:5-methylcytosine-specific restriction endonuclease McrA